MARITEDYVSSETAKLLREKGFNEPCRAVYEEKILRINTLCDYLNSELSSYVCAPTLQMAMKWLRKRQIDIVVFHERLPEDCYWARIEKYPYTEHQQEPIYQTYEEAVDAALKYVLENLI